MEQWQWCLPGLALPMISCMWVRVSRHHRRCCCCCETHLAFLPLLGFTTFSFPPLPFCTSPSSLLSSFALCFLALTAPASAVDGAHLRALMAAACSGHGGSGGAHRGWRCMVCGCGCGCGLWANRAWDWF